MRRAHADLAGLAGRDLLVVLVEDLDLAGGDREAAGQKQLGRLRIVVGLAQHRDRIAFGLAVKLREHRADPLDALDQPARRHRGSAVQQQFERGEVGLVERGMIEQHIDHGRHEQREIDPLARDGLEHRLRIEAFQHVHRAAAHQRRQHLGAGDMADRRHREIARRLGNFEIGQDRAGEAAIFAVMAQRALGFAGGAAGVIQRGDIVGAGQTARGGACRPPRSPAAGRCRSSAGPSVNTVFRPAALAARSPPRSRKVAASMTSICAFGILDLEQLVVERAQRMQPGDREPRQLRGDAGAPGVGAVGGEEGDAACPAQTELHEHVLHAADQVGRALIADRSARPAERGARRDSVKAPAASARTTVGNA